MNTHDIETVLRSFLTGDGYIAADDIPAICAAIEADRKRRGEPVELDRYDAGLLGGQDGMPAYVWHDIIRAELDRAYDFYMDQLDRAAPQPADPSLDYETLYEQMCERCDALDAKLAEYEQQRGEPVAWMYEHNGERHVLFHDPTEAERFHGLPLSTPLYAAPQPAEPSDAISVVGVPEFDALMDHIYENGTASEGVLPLANAFARALLARYGKGTP